MVHADFEIVVRKLADDLAFGTDTSRFVGSGLEYAQSRPYIPGDPIKMIDWRITARLGKPFIKEYEEIEMLFLAPLRFLSFRRRIGMTMLRWE